MFLQNSLGERIIGSIVRFEPARKLMINLQIWKNTRNHELPTLDRQYGIDTVGFLPPVYLKSGKEADKTNRAFGSVSPEVFHPVLDAIPDIAGRDFIDLGAGKGAAMIIASEYPFKSVSGIELSRYLCEIAWKNLAIVGKNFPDRVDMPLIEGDASDPVLPDGPVVIGFFNSFYNEPLDRLLERLARHAEKHEVLFVYGNPMEWAVLDRHPAFSRWFAHPFVFSPRDGGLKCCFLVWRAGPRGQPASVPLQAGAPVDSAVVIDGQLSSLVGS